METSPLRTTVDAKEPVHEQPAGTPISALARLLGPSLSAEAFFEDVWERTPRLFARSAAGTPAADGEAVAEGVDVASLLPWGDLLGVFRRAREAQRPADVGVLVMKEGCPTAEYGSCHAAYLDGCSLIVNHLDKIHAPVNAFCRELRQHLPHVFANMYLTPPDSQAVAHHADDRDVMVLQVAGSKLWRVYPDPPVPLPYPSEQVGKAPTLPVPQSVLDSAPLIERTLHAGDVLYMPRGYVHEACTGGAAASLHVTFAMATHDWSWASVASAALLSAGRASEECARIRAELEGRSQAPRGDWWWRRSAPPALICSGASDAARTAARELADVAASELAEEHGAAVSGEFMSAVLAAKVAHHSARQDSAAPQSGPPGLSPSSFVRRFTADEKAARPQQQQQGLAVREEIAQVLSRTLSGITTEPLRVSDFDDGDLVCTFSKVCFAAVCIDTGLLCACSASGERLGVDDLQGASDDAAAAPGSAVAVSGRRARARKRAAPPHARARGKRANNHAPAV